MTDPDLDKLLDDVLEEFGKPLQQPQTHADSKNSVKTKENTNFDSLNGVSKEMIDEMQQMLAEISGQAGLGEATDLQKELESISQSMDRGSEVADSGAASKETKTRATVSDTVSETLQRLKQSSTKIESELSQNSAEDEEKDLLEKMIREFGELGDSGGEAGLEGMMQTMMKQLLSKEIIFDPLKDLASKYPKWLDENRDKVSKEEVDKYSLQYTYCKQIIEVFEQNETPDFQTVTDLMHKMQECGSPPKEILDDLAPGLDFGEDGLPNVPSTEAMPDCPVQ